MVIEVSEASFKADEFLVTVGAAEWPEHFCFLIDAFLSLFLLFIRLFSTVENQEIVYFQVHSDQ